MTDAAEKFIAWMRQMKYSPESISSYTSTVMAYAKAGYKTLNDANVEAFILGNYSNPATRNKALGHLKAWSKWGRRRYKAGTFSQVELRSYKRPKRLPQTIADTNASGFIAALKGIDEQAWAVAVIQQNLGMRIGEVDRIRPENVIEPKPGVKALSFTGKGSRERIVPLNTDAALAVDTLINIPRRNRVTVRTIRRHFLKAEQQAGIPHVIPHRFRHTLATKMRGNGRSYDDISDFLGNTAEVCQNTYGGLDIDKLNSMVNGEVV